MAAAGRAGSSRRAEQLPAGQPRMGVLAQQSAEKSLKALLYARGFRRILTHSVYELIREVGQFDPSFPDQKAGAKALDSACIMARYPDSIVGSPTPSYNGEDAGECIGYADSICSAAKCSPGDRRGPGSRGDDPVPPARLRRHPLRVVCPRRLSRGERHRPRRRRGLSRTAPRGRAAAILGLTDLPVEPLCYTEEEFAELVRDENPFILRALAEGIRV